MNTPEDRGAKGDPPETKRLEIQSNLGYVNREVTSLEQETVGVLANKQDALQTLRDRLSDIEKMSIGEESDYLAQISINSQLDNPVELRKRIDELSRRIEETLNPGVIGFDDSSRTVGGRAEVINSTTFSFESWKKNINEHPELFRVDLRKTQQGLEELIIAAITKLSSGALADLAALYNDFAQQFHGQVLPLQERVDAMLRNLDSGAADVNGSEKAYFLREEYLKPYKQLLEKFGLTWFEVWKQKQNPELTKLVELQKEQAVPHGSYHDPIISTRTLKDNFTALVDAEQMLKENLESVLTELLLQINELEKFRGQNIFFVRALEYIKDLNQKTKLEIDRRGIVASNYFDTHLASLHPDIADLQALLSNTGRLDKSVRAVRIEAKLIAITDLLSREYAAPHFKNYAQKIQELIDNAKSQVDALHQEIYKDWEQQIRTNATMVPRIIRERTLTLKAELAAPNKKLTKDDLDQIEQLLTQAKNYIASSPAENNNKPHSPAQQDFLSSYLVVDLTNLLQETKREKENRGEVLDMEWLKNTLELIEANQRFVSDAASVTPGSNAESYPTLLQKIKEKVKDPGLREKMLKELNARVALHDTWLNFVIAKYSLKEIKAGYLGISPADYEVLLHDVDGVKDLVAVALSLFEIALKSEPDPTKPGEWLPCSIRIGLPKTVGAHSWKDSAGVAESHIAKMLGPKGVEAAKIAGRLVMATGMVPFYESQFKFTSPMQMRDVMNTEGRRQYYGDTERIVGAGQRAHGFTATVGKFFNVAGAINEKTGKPINPVMEYQLEPGEPPWDLVSDLWHHAVKLDKKGQKIRGPQVSVALDKKTVAKVEPLQTLARNNRYHSGEKPDFSHLLSKGIIDAAVASKLESIDWNGVVRYQNIHTVYQSGENAIGDNETTTWVEDMQKRLDFHSIITTSHFSSSDFLEKGWFETMKTAFDYLANSANGLRDLNPEDRNYQLRRIQTAFLWPVIKENSGGVDTNSLDRVWKPATLLEVIYLAGAVGFINEKQVNFLIEEAGLDGIISAAEWATIKQKALQKAGLPGK